jgi:mycofactocin glycosyltransferase
MGHKQLKPLSYHLRSGTTIIDRNGSPALLLDYPLKVVVLKPFWKEALDLLSSGESVQLETIIEAIGEDNAVAVRRFLDRLVEGGFMEREGFCRLPDYPMVSIIIPVRNRPDEIRECLASLDAVNYPRDKMEVIVVDDASTDHTPDVIREFPVRLIPLNRNRQAPFCRNLAARQAKGDILAFIDSDCLANPDWLKELVPAFMDSGIGVVGGKVDGYSMANMIDRYELTNSSLNMGDRFKRSQPRDRFFYVPSCNLLVRRGLFLELGGFNEALVVGEDVDFCWRLQDAGYDLEYRPAGTIRHKHRNRLKPFCQRRFDYGTSEPLLQKKHRTRGKRFFFPIPASFFGLVAGLAMGFMVLPLMLFSLMIPVVDASSRKRLMKRQGIHIGLSRILVCVCREYLSFFLSLCSFVSRYFLVAGLILWFVFPPVAAFLLGVHLVAGTVDYWIKKPPLNPVGFMLCFTLEQLSYQTGVWWGCLKLHCYNPLVPRIVWHKPT